MFLVPEGAVDGDRASPKARVGHGIKRPRRAASGLGLGNIRQMGPSGRLGLTEGLGMQPRVRIDSPRFGAKGGSRCVERSQGAMASPSGARPKHRCGVTRMLSSLVKNGSGEERSWT